MRPQQTISRLVPPESPLLIPSPTLNLVYVPTHTNDHEGAAAAPLVTPADDAAAHRAHTDKTSGGPENARKGDHLQSPAPITLPNGNWAAGQKMIESSHGSKMRVRLDMAQQTTRRRKPIPIHRVAWRHLTKVVHDTLYADDRQASPVIETPASQAAAAACVTSHRSLCLPHAATHGIPHASVGARNGPLAFLASK
jgi:hypothetical protein